MNIDMISTQLLYTTVPIWVEKEDGSQSSGTGFFFSFPDKNDNNMSIPLLVTNYHVVKDVDKGVFEFIGDKNGLPERNNKIHVEFDHSIINSIEDLNIDLIAIPIAPIMNELEQSGKKVFFRSVFPDMLPNKDQIDNLAAIEEITFIGYPSGLYDSYNSSPIVRRGITATPVWNNFNNEPCFLIDAGVYPGSSGSPVFIYNEGSYATSNGINIGSRLLFLGVLTESILRSEQLNRAYLGLGKVINSIETIKYLEKLVDY